jgi:DNA end-binding protein Ku
MARTLIESLASHFDPQQYKDEFRGVLLDLIERKMKGDRRSAKRRKPEPKVVDLMEALQASLNKAQEGRTRTKASGHDGETGKGARKSASKGSSASRSRRKAA